MMRIQQKMHIARKFRTYCATSVLASLVTLAVILPALPAHAAPSSGLDTPSGTNTLPLSVNGQQAITLNADTSGTVPPVPTVVFSGPINEGPLYDAHHNLMGYATTIATDGTVKISSSDSTNPVLSVTGAVTIGNPVFTANFPYLGVNTTNDSPASFSTSNAFRSEVWVNDTTSTMWGLAVSGSSPGAYPAAGSFYIDQNIAGPRLTIDTSGNVGINTLTPQAKLDVNGFILINTAGTVVEGSNCPTTGLVGRDSNGGLFDCQYNTSSGTTTWGRPQTFTSIVTNIGAVDAACSGSGSTYDPNPPNYDRLAYNTTCASRFCEQQLQYGFGMLTEIPPNAGYNPTLPYQSAASVVVVIACSR